VYGTALGSNTLPFTDSTGIGQWSMLAPNTTSNTLLQYEGFEITFPESITAQGITPSAVRPENNEAAPSSKPSTGTDMGTCSCT
jgi:hypothetical protein